MKKQMQYILVFISLLMCLAGAVNSGITFFVFAIPYMCYVIYFSYGKGKTLFRLSLFFVAGCIFVNLTQDSNPLLYPLLKDGTVTITKEDGYKFTQYTSPTLKKGEVYKVTGIAHSDPDLASQINVVTEVGTFDLCDYSNTCSSRSVVFNKPIQSVWSKELDRLYNYWMFPPLYLIYFIYDRNHI